MATFGEGTESGQFKGLHRVVDIVHSQGAKNGIQPWSLLMLVGKGLLLLLG